MTGLKNHPLNDLTEKIIKAFYKVYNTLGYGFLEKVYVRALILELNKMGILAKSESPVKVYYDSNVIGEYSADLLVEDQIIVKSKQQKRLFLTMKRNYSII